MATMVSRLLDMADWLISEKPRSSAFRRRAVSTAYYAVFHAVAKVCADNLLEPVERTSEEYERVYRALEHGTLKKAFEQRKSPLSERESLRKVGELIVPLRSERFKADYFPPIQNVFSHERAEELVAQARRAVAEIDALNDEDRRTLATWLLFKSPPQ